MNKIIRSFKHDPVWKALTNGRKYGLDQFTMLKEGAQNTVYQASMLHVEELWKRKDDRRG